MANAWKDIGGTGENSEAESAYTPFVGGDLLVRLAWFSRGSGKWSAH